MATPPSDDTRMLFKLLADGRWHTYTEIRAKLAAAVPPGRALRKYQERVNYARSYKNDPDYDTSASETDRIYFGQRACAQVVLTSWKDRGLEYFGDGPNRQVRIRPGFNSWGLVSDGAPTPTDEGSDAAEPQHDPPEGASVSEPNPHASREQLAANGSAPIDMGFMSLPPLLAVGSALVPPTPVTVSEQSPTATEPGDAPGDAVPAPAAAEIPPVEGSDMALFSESEVRHIVQDVITTVLDRFQAGMNDYLDEQFSLLEGIIRAQETKPRRWRTWTVEEEISEK